MKTATNETLNNIMEQLSDIVAVSDEVIDFIETSEICKKIGGIQTEIAQLLEGQASIEWYKALDIACQKKNVNMWAHEIASAFKKGIPCHIAREAMEEAKDVRKFQELVEMKYAESDTRDPSGETQLSDTMAVGKQDDFAGKTMEIMEDYMDRQVEEPLGNINQADQLIKLAMNARDALKEYTDRINCLEGIVSSQKQLLNNQRQSLMEQEKIIKEQKAAIERYEKQLERVNRQYNDMNQTLLRLNNIQTELRMIGQED